MKELIATLTQLANEELERANEKFPQFASAHEAYSVMLEEFEEAEAEIRYLKDAMSFLWLQIKADDKQIRAEALEAHAVRLAAEAVQCVAMSMKFQCLLGKGEGKSNDSKNS